MTADLGSHVRQLLGRRDLGRGHLMVRPLLLDLERRGHVKDLLTVLDRDHAAAREAAAVATAVDLVDDRRGEVAATEKVRVQRMHEPIVHRGTGRHQRLPEHLATEHLWTADVAALAAKQVVLEALELEQADQVREQPVHARAGTVQPLTPSRFCMMGLVVVYCRCTFFAGFRCSAIAKAARAASWKPLRMSFFLPG